MTVRAPQRLVAELRERAQLAVPASPHSFRKNFATNVVAASNVRVAQKLLGHRRLQTLVIYTHPSEAEFAQAVDRLGEVRP